MLDKQKKKFLDDTINANAVEKLVLQAKSKTVYNFVNKDDEAKTAIIWCLHAVMRYFSYRDTAVQCFPMMFPDSKIAAKMHLSKDKVGYTTVHGLANYFRDQLTESLKACEHLLASMKA